MKTNLTDIFVVAYLMMNIFACGTSSESESETSWTLEVVDSIQVAHLGEMMLLDISPNEDYFLTADYQKNSYFLVDPSGEIIQEYNKSGDQPDSFGFAFSEMSFWGDTSVFVIGSKGLKWYDLSGNEIKII